MTAIIKREMYSYFCSPMAYVVMAIYLFFSGLFFSLICLGNSTSEMAYVFSNMFLVTIFATPVMCMRLMADEKRLKTDQALLTSPVSILGIVLGKFFSACLLYLICMSIFLIFGFTLSFFVAPKWPVIICNFLGLLLLGATLIAIDLFLSSLTESQMIANVANAVSITIVSDALKAVSFLTHYQNFTVGLLSLAHIVFFLSLTALFIFLTVRVIEKKRWS